MTTAGLLRRINILHARIPDETATLSNGSAVTASGSTGPVAAVGGPLDRPVRLMFAREVASVSAATLSPREQIDQLIVLERMKAHLEFRQLQVLSVMAELDPSEQQCVIEEVRCALRLSAVAVRGRFELADVLSRSLPRTFAALENGVISVRHAQVVSDAAHRLPGADAHRELEDRLIGRAPSQTAGDLSRSANRAVHRIDPEGAARRHAVASEERRLVRQALEDGMAELRLHAPAAAVAAVWTRLDAYARQLGAQDPRTIDQRRADLLIDILLAGSSVNRPEPSSPPATRVSAAAVPSGPVPSGPVPSGPVPSGPVPSAPVPSAPGLSTQQGLAPRIEVVVSLSTLLGLDDQPADLAGYGTITAQTARELAGRADATWRRLVTDPMTGSLIDYGRTTYRPPADLRDFVLARDAVCAFPGCNMPGRLSQIDHLVAYDGDESGQLGRTSRANTAPLCCRHHNGKTRREWKYERQVDGSYRWTSRRTGRTYLSLIPERWNHPDVPAIPALSSESASNSAATLSSGPTLSSDPVLPAGALLPDQVEDPPF